MSDGLVLSSSALGLENSTVQFQHVSFLFFPLLLYERAHYVFQHRKRRNSEMFIEDVYPHSYMYLMSHFRVLGYLKRSVYKQCLINLLSYLP